jgi:tetratricopeptide (TPR) repeat protein
VPRADRYNTRADLKRYLLDLDDIGRRNVLVVINELPPPSNRWFKRRLTVFLTVDDQQDLVGTLESILDSPDSDGSLETVVDRDDLSPEYRTLFVEFACFYYLTSYYRRRNDVEEVNSLHDEYGDRFDRNVDRRFEDPFEEGVTTLYRLADINRAAVTDADESVDIVDDAETLVDNAPDDHFEIMHTYAVQLHDSVADGAVEADERDRRLETAEEYIERVLEEDDEYGRYHHTRAKIHLLRAEYDDAREKLDEAIRQEDADIYDYEIRMSMYHKMYPEITVEEVGVEVEKVDRLEDQVQRAKDDIDDKIGNIENAEEKADNLQANFILFLGFFTGVLTIAIVFINQASSPTGAATASVAQAVQTVFGLASGLVFAFGGLVLLVPSREPRRRVGISVALLFLSVIGVVVALKIVPWLSNTSVSTLLGSL